MQNYLDLIAAEDQKHQNLVLIPGADVAPVYFFTGVPLTESFTIRQWSEQLTVFGNKNAKFYKGLPALHNEELGFDWTGLFPLILLTKYKPQAGAVIPA